MLKKKISSDGKFLLGIDKDGYQYWLEKGNWDCGWYWSFGYIYYGNSFSHFDSLFGQDEKDFACNFYEGFTSRIIESPLYQPGESKTNHKRLWEFCDLARTIYILKEAAEVLGIGGSHYIGNPLCKDLVKDEAYVKHLNEQVLPELIKTAEGLLDPNVQ